ncbi:MAG: hypothetical protein ABI858_01805 [Pseudoxanthomonas sp.]
MRKLGWFLVLAFASGSALAQAPFCVVTSGVTNCFYYDVQSCQQAARSMNGLCSANPQAGQPRASQPAPQPSVVAPIYFDTAEAGRKGYEAGVQRRQAQEQSELNRLQQQVLRQQIAQREVAASADADPDGKALAQIAVTAKALHHACGLSQALGSPAGMKLTEDEALQGFACTVFAQGAYATAVAASGFSSPDKSISFCSPRDGGNGRTLVDAIVAAGNQNPGLLAPEMSSGSLLIYALASLSSCQPTLH